MNVRDRGVRGWTAFAAILLMASVSLATAAGTYHVDRLNPSCSNAGPGSAAAPYCTITAAVNARAGAGTTILVHPGRYREQVTITASGVANSPFMLQAAAPGVLVDGSDDFSNPALWQPYSGDVFVAASASWAPRQVFVDGGRLTGSTETLPAAIAPGTFLAVAGEGLYVNLGGSNPGAHVTDVGHRLFGFLLNGRSWVSIDGFEVARVDNRGIALNTGSDDVVVSNNTVTLNRFQGIAVSDSHRALVSGNTVGENADHGIYLINSTSSVVRGNESYANARPTVRAANGLALTGSTGNLLENNRLHDNQDTGMQIFGGSHNNLSRQNISWQNGDHGYDHVSSSNNQHIGDVAWGNFKDGFSQEGDAPGNLLYNCIGVDNGLTTAEFNLWVDDTSAPGFRSDYNIFWNSNGQAPIKYISTTYASVTDYAAATGLDTHSIQGNPRFADPAAGDFQLTTLSPAIDSATSKAPNWPSQDANGSARKDETHTANTGAGAVLFADRGAFEFDPNEWSAPTAALVATPSSGQAPLLVTLNASGSSDPGGSIVSYTFDFGDGSPVAGPQASATTSHTYAVGAWTASVTVTNNSGLTATATAPVSAIANQAPDGVIDSPSGDITITVGESVNFQGTGTDPDGNTPLTYLWTFGNAAPSSTLEDPGDIVFTKQGNYNVTFTVTDSRGLADPTPAIVTIRVRK